jgi:PBSX family phage terminase large subunit
MEYDIEIDKDVYLDVYHDLLDDADDIDIEFIYGGRDSGKSKFVAQRLTEKSLSADYFRCLLIKETHESIEAAQWQMIKDVAEDWNVDHLYHFTKKPLAITCINKNTFLTRGMNDPQRIRSLTNPSDAWVEEGNQLTKDGFITLLTSLRSDYGKVKLWFTFNPEPDVPDYRDFWLYQMFFEKYDGQLNFIGEYIIKLQVRGIEKEIRLKYRCTHVTYQDNPYVSDQRIAFHEMLKDTDEYYYNIFTLGKWGRLKTGAEFYPYFSENVHVSDKFIFDPSLPVHLTYDFNSVPYMTCIPIQYIEEPEKIRFRIFDEYCLPSPFNSVLAVTEAFIDDYEKWLHTIFYYGDASGNNRIAGKGDEVNYDDVRLALAKYVDPGSDRTSRFNKPVLKRRKLLNLALSGHLYLGKKKIIIEIHPKCKKTITDFKFLKQGQNGKLKEEEKNTLTGIKYQKYGHTTDAVEYCFCDLFDMLM